MGLTGIILDATIRLLPIETSRCAVDTTRAADLDELHGADGRRRPLLPLLGGVDRPARQGCPPRPGRAHPGRSRHARPARPAGRRRSARLRAPSGRRGASARPAAGRPQPRQRRRVQRGVVPQGAAATDRPDRLDPRLLPPARLDRLVEPAVRAARVPAVPVRRAVRRRGRAAHGGRAARRLGHAELPVGAEAIRCRQPRPAQLPDARLDADPRPAGRVARARRRCCTVSTTSCSSAGGRHYLAKDAHATPDAIRRGYPRLDEWRAVRAAVDPTGVWASDLSRRLRLLED